MQGLGRPGGQTKWNRSGSVGVFDRGRMFARSGSIARFTFLVVLLTVGCGKPAPSPSATPILPTPSSSTVSLPLEGGCEQTHVFGAPGPGAAASLGLSQSAWAAAAPAERGLVAFFFSRSAPLLTANRHPPPGQSNKILWFDALGASSDLVIAAHPAGTETPIVRFRIPPAASPTGAYPSTIDLPSGGCWRLDIDVAGQPASMSLLVAAPTG
jgi:hypothetical protein